MSGLEETDPIENERIIIERERFKLMLEKYRFMQFKDKTQIYKNLNFVIHDKNNYTMPCKDKRLNKTVRQVVLNYNTYLTVKRLYETNIDF